VAAKYIARWNGTAWSALGTGMNERVFAFAVLPSGDLVAGGFFTTAGSQVSAHVARWGSPCRCVADVDDGTFTGTPDGGVGIEDLLYYLNIYDAGTLRADVDDGSSTGTPDGGVGIEDLLYFLVRFDAGC
jgi:hypothetical protein